MSDQLWIATVLFGAMCFIIWIAFKTPGDQGKPPAMHVETPSPTPTQIEQRATPGGGWSMTGWTVAVCGSIGLALALTMKSTVETYMPSTVLGPAGSSEVANLDLMFQKGVAVAGSLSAVGVGVFCIAVSAIIKTIRGGRDK
ncbi:hypothetical protein [Sphingopyxis sp. NJF-3]